METRARYVLIGLFSLAVIAAGFGFVYWLENSAALKERAYYRIRFDSPVPGLLLGSAVQFNGIRVGEVTDLRLDPDDPRQVMVTIAVAGDTPLRTDTAIGLAFGGLTGVPEIQLSGGTPDARRPEASGGEPPLLVAEPGASVSWTQAAQQAFTRVDTILAENSEALKTTIANLDTFSDALARNADSLDDIVAGLARLAGVRAGGRAQVYYELPGADEFPTIDAMPAGQLVVNQLTVPVVLDSQQFMVHSAGADQPAFADAAWSDTVPRLVQAAIIRSFENAGYFRVGREFENLASEYALLIDMDTFRVATEPALEAEIALSAKIVGSDGLIVAARRFEARAPVAALEAGRAANALQAAFKETAADLVVWALAAIGGA